MTYAIVYSSKTGNTEMLARTVQQELPEKDCIYFGAPDPSALKAERIYLGFWTDRGTCDEDSLKFLKSLTTQELFLFGTAGFGGGKEYFNTILENITSRLNKNLTLTGSFICQGKMPPAVRQRYEKMMADPAQKNRMQTMIDNFDRALTHPDADDLRALRSALHSL